MSLLHSTNPATNRWTRSLNTQSKTFLEIIFCFRFFHVASWPNLGLRRKRVGRKPTFRRHSMRALTIISFKLYSLSNT